MTVLVSNRQNQSELLTDFTSLSIKRKINETYQTSFSVLKTDRNKHSYPLVLDDSIISLDQDFVIKQLTDNPNSKSITALHSFFECIGDFVEEKYPEGLYTINQAMTIAFGPSDWGFHIRDIGNDISDMRLMSEFGSNNTVAILSQILEAFDCEYDVDSSTKTVTVMKRLGIQTDFQIRYKHNLTAISKSINSENVRTAVKVYYNQDEFGNYGSVLTYRSLKESYYPKTKWAEPLYLEGVVEESVALEQAKLYLKDTPEVSLKVEFTELQKAGYNSDDVELGNTVFLIDDRMNLDGDARIVEIERFPFDKSRAPIISITNVTNKITDRLIKQKQEQQVLERTAVKQRTIYNGCTITPEDGFKATAQNGVVTFLNATEGIAIIKNNMYKFYVNTDGELILDGKLEITHNGHKMLEAYMDRAGGTLKIRDDGGKLNVAIGSNKYTTTNIGGALFIYNDGDEISDARVELSIDTDDYGGLYLRSSNTARINLEAENDGDAGLSIRGSDGELTTYKEDKAVIKGQRVVTEDILDALEDRMRTYVDDEIEILREYVDDEIDWLWDQIPRGD